MSCCWACAQPVAKPSAPPDTPPSGHSGSATAIEAAREALRAGRQALQNGDAPSAARHARTGLDALAARGVPDEAPAAELHDVLGQAEFAQKAYARARAAFAQELAMLQASSNEPSEDVALVLQRTAMTHTMQKDFAQAERLLKDSLAVRRALTPADPVAVATSLGELANVLVQAGRTEEARAVVTEALSLLRPGAEREDRRFYQLQMVMSEAHRKEGNFASAVATFTAAVEAARRHESEMAQFLVEALQRLAATHDQLGNREAALAVLIEALQVTERNARTHSSFALAASLIRRYGELGQPAQAEELFRRYRGIERTLVTKDRRIEDGPIGADGSPRVSRASSVSSPAERSAQAHRPSAPQQANPSTDGEVSNAAVVVSEMRAGFRACYNVALRQDPRTEGGMSLTLLIDESGSVEIASAQALGLRVDVVDCVLKRAAEGRFAQPAEGRAVIKVPVTFVRTQ